MFEIMAQNKTFKEIDNKHTMICIEDVSATKDGAIKVRDRLNKNREGKTNVWSITKYEV